MFPTSVAAENRDPCGCGCQWNAHLLAAPALMGNPLRGYPLEDVVGYSRQPVGYTPSTAGYTTMSSANGNYGRFPMPAQQQMLFPAPAPPTHRSPIRQAVQDAPVLLNVPDMREYLHGITLSTSIFEDIPGPPAPIFPPNPIINPAYLRCVQMAQNARPDPMLNSNAPVASSDSLSTAQLEALLQEQLSMVQDTMEKLNARRSNDLMPTFSLDQTIRENILTNLKTLQRFMEERTTTSASNLAASNPEVDEDDDEYSFCSYTSWLDESGKVDEHVCREISNQIEDFDMLAIKLKERASLRKSMTIEQDTIESASDITVLSSDDDDFSKCSDVPSQCQDASDETKCEKSVASSDSEEEEESVYSDEVNSEDEKTSSEECDSEVDCSDKCSDVPSQCQDASDETKSVVVQQAAIDEKSVASSDSGEEEESTYSDELDSEDEKTSSEECDSEDKPESEPKDEEKPEEVAATAESAQVRPTTSLMGLVKTYIWSKTRATQTINNVLKGALSDSDDYSDESEDEDEEEEEEESDGSGESEEEEDEEEEEESDGSGESEEKNEKTEKVDNSSSDKSKSEFKDEETLEEILKTLNLRSKSTVTVYPWAQPLEADSSCSDESESGSDEEESGSSCSDESEYEDEEDEEEDEEDEEDVCEKDSKLDTMTSTKNAEEEEKKAVCEKDSKLETMTSTKNAPSINPIVAAQSSGAAIPNPIRSVAVVFIYDIEDLTLISSKTVNEIDRLCTPLSIDSNRLGGLVKLVNAHFTDMTKVRETQMTKNITKNEAMEVDYEEHKKFFAKIAEASKAGGPIISYDLLERIGLAHQHAQYCETAERHQKLFHQPWKSARKCLSAIRNPSLMGTYENVVLCSEGAANGASQLLVTSLAADVPIGNIVSTYSVSIDTILAQIKRTYVDTCTSIVITSNDKTIAAAHKLNMTYWRVTAKESFDSLHNLQKSYLLK